MHSLSSDFGSLKSLGGKSLYLFICFLASHFIDLPFGAHCSPLQGLVEKLNQLLNSFCKGSAFGFPFPYDFDLLSVLALLQQ